MFCTNWIVEFKFLPFGVSHSRYLVLMVLAFKGVDANHHCSWCRNFSCVPSSHWNCDGENNNRANCKVHAYYLFTFENVEFTIFPNLLFPTIWNKTSWLKINVMPMIRRREKWKKNGTCRGWKNLTCVTCRSKNHHQDIKLLACH